MGPDTVPAMDSSIKRPMKPTNRHYWISLLLGLCVVPVLRSQHLPLKVDWVTLGVAFWLLLAAQAIFLAVVLAVIGNCRWSLVVRRRDQRPMTDDQEQLLGPFFTGLLANPLRIFVLLLFVLALAWLTSWLKALVLGVDAIALLELFNRQRGRGLQQAATSVFPAAAYLFFGFLMVLAYNCAIVSVRFNFTLDPAFGAMDRWLLWGHSVSELAHWSVRTFPISFFQGLEFIYFGMFPQIGAALILVALSDGRARALQFVGTILVSYYLALAIFYIWPSQGPYYLCPGHFSRFPESLQVYKLQQTLIRDALAMWRHQPITRISTDYFIGLPCMHLAQPMIVIWFLRRWRKMVFALAAYDVFLTAAVLMLEQHYVVDVLAGFLVAGLAIAITGGPFQNENIPPARLGAAPDQGFTTGSTIGAPSAQTVRK